MANRLSVGHILLVRRHNYIPTYFSSVEFQLQENKENSDFKLDAADLSDSERRCASHISHDISSKNNNEYLTFPAMRTPVFPMEPGTCTARFLCSGVAKRFSCNVSKMTHRMSTKLSCDGYYGCPQESTFEKENAIAKPRKPVCLMPWKKRSKRNNEQKSNGKPKTQPQLSCSHDDCLNSKASKFPQTRGSHRGTMQCLGPKSHPAMFYSYYLAKGYEFRKICAPKRRACDGYFGCYDNSMDRKASEKRQQRKK